MFTQKTSAQAFSKASLGYISKECIPESILMYTTGVTKTACQCFLKTYTKDARDLAADTVQEATLKYQTKRNEVCVGYKGVLFGFTKYSLMVCVYCQHLNSV